MILSARMDTCHPSSPTRFVLFSYQYILLPGGIRVYPEKHCGSRYLFSFTSQSHPFLRSSFFLLLFLKQWWCILFPSPIFFLSSDLTLDQPPSSPRLDSFVLFVCLCPFFPTCVMPSMVVSFFFVFLCLID